MNVFHQPSGMVVRSVDDFVLSIRKDKSFYVVTSSTGAELCVPTFVLPPLAPDDCGKWLYQQLFTGQIHADYQQHRPDRLFLFVPEELLDWPWRRLHDTSQFLALYHPIILLSKETIEPDSPLVTHMPLRILFTGGSSKQGMFTLEREESILRAFEQQQAEHVKLDVERGPLKKRDLIEVLRNRVKPIHIWHHSGSCGLDLSLELVDGTQDASLLHYLVGLRPELRCLVLHTLAPGPRDSALRTFNIPFIIRFESLFSSEATLALIKTFYQHLLTRDLAIACTLAQLDFYKNRRQSKEWSSVSMLASTSHLFLVNRKDKQITFPVRVLILKANPWRDEKKQRLELMRIDHEVRAIKQISREHQDCFDVQDQGATRPQDISSSLLWNRPHILQFSGHGLPSGYLAFEKDDGETARVEFQAFSNMLSSFKDTLCCVVLNACYTLPLAEACCQHIDCVIGTSDTLDDGIAADFSRGFYQALANGESLGTAFQLACSELDIVMEKHPSWKPELKCRSGVNPDKIFLVPVRKSG